MFFLAQAARGLWVGPVWQMVLSRWILS